MRMEDGAEYSGKVLAGEGVFDLMAVYSRSMEIITRGRISGKKRIYGEGAVLRIRRGQYLYRGHFKEEGDFAGYGSLELNQMTVRFTREDSWIRSAPMVKEFRPMNPELYTVEVGQKGEKQGARYPRFWGWHKLYWKVSPGIGNRRLLRLGRRSFNKFIPR